MNKDLEKTYLDILNGIERHSIDTEANHRYADNVLCDLISELGYNRVGEAFRRIDKRYF